MKLKTYTTLSIIILMFTASIVYASTPITGTSYGENFGLIHFDYTTAVNPFAECDHESPDFNTPNCPNSDAKNQTPEPLVLSYS
ncbi:hypothetical protein KKA95_00635, partial [Patescibacteria group bacterium]|nr:hypothetical protein [Patescibacteria group bacterium]